jgi:hypothetical protein
MSEPRKETVIIVHGTFAREGKWYRPPAGDFVVKLNAALQERGSPARCWAHCRDEAKIFSWSGENNWRYRVKAAYELAKHIKDAQDHGWLCHVVAHSHGGNVVVDALVNKSIREGGKLGNIVTLGTPFIDAQTEIEKRRNIGFLIEKIIAMLIIFALSVLIVAVAMQPIFSMLLIDSALLSLGVFLIYKATLGLYGMTRRRFARKSDASMSRETGKSNLVEQKEILAIGSDVDEAWQILNYMRNGANALAIKDNIISHVISAAKAEYDVAYAVGKVRGAVYYGDLSGIGKIVLLLMYGVVIATPIFLLTNIGSWGSIVGLGDVPPPEYFIGVLAYSTLLVWLLMLAALSLLRAISSRRDLYSAFWSPFRWCRRCAASAFAAAGAFGGYFMPFLVWRYLQRKAMGLQGLGGPLPEVARDSLAREDILIIPEASPCADRALKKLGDFLASQYAERSGEFSKLVETSTNVNKLLAAIANEAKLVHGAYYEDEGCIARIADWIYGKSGGLNPAERSGTAAQAAVSAAGS